MESQAVHCYACSQVYPTSQYPLEYDENGAACCPECGSDFVEVISQVAQRASATEAARPQRGTAPHADPALTGAGAGGSPQAQAQGTAPPSAQGPRNPAGRGPRIEFHATFDRRPVHAHAPLNFVDAISRFAPLSLPDGQQAFVLQVQDGALLSPFTMGMPFGDTAAALNPADWVVGDDLDAVVTRLLDAYAPPRRATAQEVRDSLPRLRVRPAAAAAAAAGACTATAAAAAVGGRQERVCVRLEPAKQDTQEEASDAPLRLKLSVQEDAPSEASAPAVAMAPPAAAAGTEAAAAPAERPAGASSDGAGADDGCASCRAGEVCTVCHDAFEAGGEVVELPCRHCFHEGCIMPWLQQQNTCPVCRTRLKEGAGGRHQHAASGHGAPASASAAATATAGAGGGDRAVPTEAAAAAGTGPRQQQQPQQPQQRPGLAMPSLQQLLGGLSGFPFAPPMAAAPAPQPSQVLTAEARQAAEAAFASLRTRFEPMVLTNARSSGPAGAASGPRAAQGAAASGRSGSPPQRQAAATSALRGGFLNQVVNLYGGPAAPPAAASESNAAAAGGGGGTRSALRGGFFNAGRGASAPAAQPRSSTSPPSAAGTDPSPQQQQQQQREAQLRAAAAAMGMSPSLLDAMTAAFFPAASELMPRMLWSMSLANVAEREGIMDLTSRTGARASRSSPSAAGGGGSGSAGLDLDSLLRGMLPMAASAAAAAPSRSGSGSATASVASSAGGRAGALPAGLLRGLPLRGGDGVPDLPAMLESLERRLVERVAQRADARGEARPSEEQLRGVQRRALRGAETMVRSLAMAVGNPSLMPRIVELSERWLQQVTEAVRRPAAPSAGAASSSSGVGAAAAPAGTQRQRESREAAGAGGDGEEGRQAAGGSGDEDPEEGRPTRRVARRSEAEDAASRAHGRHNEGQQAAAGAHAAEARGTGIGDGGAAGQEQAAEGQGRRGGKAAGARGRVVVTPRVGHARPRGLGGSAAAAAATPAAAAPARDAHGADAEGASRSGGAEQGRASPGPDAQNGGRRGGGGGLNPLSLVVGGAGAGLRLLGGLAGALLRRNSGGSAPGGNGGGSGSSAGGQSSGAGADA